MQGWIHLAVFHWGNKLYNNRNYIDGSSHNSVMPVWRRPPGGDPGNPWAPMATAYPANDEVAAVIVPDTPRDDPPPPREEERSAPPVAESSTEMAPIAKET